MKSTVTDMLNESPVAPPRARRSVVDSDRWTSLWDKQGNHSKLENGAGNGARRGSAEGYSHSYMPRHLSSKSSNYWAKHNGKGPPYLNSEDPLHDVPTRSKDGVHSSESEAASDSLEVDVESQRKSDQSKHMMKSYDHGKDKLHQLRQRSKSCDQKKNASVQSKPLLKTHDSVEGTMDQSKHGIGVYDGEDKHEKSKTNFQSHGLNNDTSEQIEYVRSFQHSKDRIDQSKPRTVSSRSHDQALHRRGEKYHISKEAMVEKNDPQHQVNSQLPSKGQSHFPSDVNDHLPDGKRHLSCEDAPISDLSRLQVKEHAKMTSLEASSKRLVMKPPLVRQSTEPDILTSDCNPESSNVSGRPGLTSKYLRNEGSTQRTGRRSMSDLGFRRSSPGLRRSNSRTMALLDNPVFRKSLARTMRLDPNEDSFSEEVCDKLSTRVEESFDQSLSLSLTQSSGSIPGVRLCCSTSDLGLLRDLHSQFESDGVTATNRSGDADSIDKLRATRMSYDAEYLNVSQSGVSKISPRTLSASKTVSDFRIPSFNEFRVLRGRQRCKSQSTTNLENVVPTILEEDSNANSDTAGSACSLNVSKVKTAVVASQPAEDSSQDDVFDKPVEGTPTKIKVRRRRRKHSKKSQLPDTRNSPNLLPKSQSVSVISCCDDLEKVNKSSRSHKQYKDRGISHGVNGVKSQSQRHISVMNTESSWDDNSSQKESAKKAYKNRSKSLMTHMTRSQSEDLIKNNCNSHKAKQNAILSDYVSDSNAELSDNLEDVFLKPNDCKRSSVTISASDMKFSLKDHVRETCWEKKGPLSDSGCLMSYRRSCDLELTNEMRPHDGDDDGMIRSTSDVSDMFTEEIRTKNGRERRTKQYSSDPLNTGDGKVDPNGRHGNYPMVRQDSKEDILNFLEMKTASNTSIISGSHGYSSEKPKKYKSRMKRVTAKPPTGRKKLSSSVEVERADSGVGRETQENTFKEQVVICEACGELLCHSPDVTSDDHYDVLCSQCIQRRRQRKEAILEIIDTEQNYGNDLNIINEHFYERMKTTGLLTPDQMKTIFINLKELISVNQYFSHQLQNALDTAAKMSDESLQSVHIGQLFLDSTNMLMAYESYCINQSSAPILLDQLLEEKDLLRIFLEVTQREKSVLRKMDLKAFLMVPVQRVMKYPLLLSRLHKVSLPTHPDCDLVMQAHKKVANILELINSKTKGSASTKLRRRMSLLRKSGEFDNSVFENIEVHKVAMELLGWDRSNLHFVRTGRLQCYTILDHLSLKRVKTVKYISVHAVLVSRATSTNDEAASKSPTLTHTAGVESAALVIVKDKGGKQQPVRDPFRLHQCVVCRDSENTDIFEVHEANKESLLFKCEKAEDAEEWLKQLSDLIGRLSQWRHRRNALANIMLQDL